MEFPAKPINGEPVPHGTIASSSLRALQQPATNRQLRRLARTGDAPEALQTFHWPNRTAARDHGKRKISADAVRED